MLKNLVSKLRQRKGVSKSVLARKIGVCPSYVTRLEKNDIQPSGEVMFRIAEYLNCRIEEVFQPEKPFGKKR